MNAGDTYLGDSRLSEQSKPIEGQFTNISGELFYKISHYNMMDDFFMSIVSDSDHWMFLSSNGSLSAGRKNRDNALFPYYTDDKIHDYKGITGSLTVLRIHRDDRVLLWEPFSEFSERIYNTECNLYKSIYGNKIIFEEINHDLGLSFSYMWSNSEKFGFVRSSKVHNLSGDLQTMEVLDGIQNILPYGVDYDFQNAYSNLLDGYKKSELLTSSGVGLFMLSSIPVDRAEPSESLRSTLVWSQGTVSSRKILLSTQQVKSFCQGAVIEEEVDVRARRGAYLVHQHFKLSPQQDRDWYIVAEVNQDAADVKNRESFILCTPNIIELLKADVVAGTEHLKQIVASADGLQASNEKLGVARHFSNTMFNVMRGGMFTNHYTIEREDFSLFVNQTNHNIAQRYTSFLAQLPLFFDYNFLIDKVNAEGCADFTRICMEYLPLTFSRRHGDPSRPWNVFSIDTKNEDGSPKLNFQGNWRDIFQNWEALCLSYPEYVEGIIAKFVNATTADGYNPYRISRDGIDWERPDPNDPWAYIGYWGDHQIIYLQKLLEQSKAYHPAKFETMLTQSIFAYANVPYRIKSYADIVKNPKDTINFDFALDREIKAKVKKVGADARLMYTPQGELVKTNLVEKVMTTLLAKLSNFIPEAGIWLNTQRPEWNDANNALVGNGVSMVTLYYIRRFVRFWADTLAHSSFVQVAFSSELNTLFVAINHVFMSHESSLASGFSDADRKKVCDALGQAGQAYRDTIYDQGFSGKMDTLSTKALMEFMHLTLAYVDQSIRVNKREDGLYHAYNLMVYNEGGILIRHLYEMLEGQVAVLSAGYLSVQESLDVLDSLKSSALFREDQYSYILYPDRELARFENKNNLSQAQVKRSSLLQHLAAQGDKNIVVRDNDNVLHFNGAIRNSEELKSILNEVSEEASEAEVQIILDIYEEIFDHRSFTGRSGTFYAYEGLGSIYWHMVSKLLLATQEIHRRAVVEGAGSDVVGRLRQHYYEIKAGIGLYKSPELYGAFPTDAYSHTPKGKGAQQPGMTGQVKEDVISRFGELGLSVSNGEISFHPNLFSFDELLDTPTRFSYFDLKGNEKTLLLDAKQMAFTYCQVPVIYKQGSCLSIQLLLNGGRSVSFEGHTIDALRSAMIFERRGTVERIDVTISKR